MPTALKVDVSTRPGRLVLTVAGELDFDTCPLVSGAVAVLPLWGRVLTVDLSAVTFMDSSGLHLLIALCRRADREGGSLELTGVPAQALRVLELTGAEDLFTVLPATVIPAPSARPGLPRARRQR
ncbi:STAS domain-containing protein [Streptomyces sp. NPDC101132]|uniref:STAS domain-containing protein n=1 Tax=Streptomyces sp. NPDC101132 TaxID=3366110 RepID=UPI003801C7FE